MKRLTVMFVLLLAAFAVRAEQPALQDPMRPPPLVAGQGDAVPADVAAPQVEAVRIAGGKRLAVMAGQTVHEGDRWQDGKISRITESGVWVSRPGGREFLSLYPAVEKKLRKAH